MTLAELRTKLRRLIGSPSTTAISDARLTELLNQSHREIGVRYRFHRARSTQTFPTVSGTKRYTLPTDVGVLMKVWNGTEQQRLEKVDSTHFAEIDAQLTINPGPPQKYYRAHDWIELIPVPDAVYTIGLFYKTTIADMALDADEPLLPLPWHIGVVYHARWAYYDEEGNSEKSTYSWNQWTLWVNSIPNEVDEETFADREDAVRVPTLGEWRGGRKRLDWDHEDH